MPTFATPSTIHARGTRRPSIVRHALWTVVAVLAVSGCGSRETEEKERIPIRAVHAAAETISRTLDYASTIEAWDKAEVFPKVNGKIIEKLKEDGEPIDKGEVIAYIDRDEVGFKFEKAPVESPLAGLVGRIYVDKGTNVTAQTAVALVVAIDQVKVRLDVPERYLPQVSIGQTARVRVDAYPGTVFDGTVTRISPVVEIETRTAPVEISIDNADHRLKPGMFAGVQLVLEQRENVLTVLQEAVIGREPDTYVFVVNDGVARVRNVALGLRENYRVEVREGLKAGDMVAVMGQERLRDGAAVSVEIDGEQPQATPTASTGRDPQPTAVD
ncbi:MAG: efflux RND transporter periplasmic adaptor subunit [Candidatus Aureabacteria bacterium]|nr:efflux RND transporter periplasmic adaptor subunit [Candidatus Auribacterota bacterium]NLW94216.1 efflux RND transporter periplasmic adaptor subunit [Chlamydiota bacterium]